MSRRIDQRRWAEDVQRSWIGGVDGSSSAAEGQGQDWNGGEELHICGDWRTSW